MALGKNLKEQREARGWSQSELSRRTNDIVSQGAISAIEKRNSKASEFAPTLADALGISLGMLMGLQQEQAEYISNIRQDACPVISWVKAGELCDTDFVLDYETSEEWRYCPVKHSDKTFVLIVDGDSMQPDYPDKIEIFVDPMIQAIHNDDVVVCSPQGKASFKRLQISNDGSHLLALNPNWPNRIIEVPEGTTICGVVIYSGRKRR